MRHYRISDQNPIKTKRLILTPLTAKQLAALEAQEQDELLRGALVSMRKNVVEDPGFALWYTGWQVSLKNGGTPVGLLGFHGPVADQTVELGYEIQQEYRGNGYCEEAAKALISWAFGCDGVYFISVLAAECNAASNHILEKLKFYRVESPVADSNAWELERPASAWMSVYMALGIAIGLSFGQTLFNNMAIGLAIGIGTGLALGSGLDAQDRAARKREHPPKKLETPASEGKEPKN
jgi:ribosomal-protein-alanine N-acetyltransferase